VFEDIGSNVLLEEPPVSPQKVYSRGVCNIENGVQLFEEEMVGPDAIEESHLLSVALVSV